MRGLWKKENPRVGKMQRTNKSTKQMKNLGQDLAQNQRGNPKNLGQNLSTKGKCEIKGNTLSKTMSHCKNRGETLDRIQIQELSKTKSQIKVQNLQQN